MPRLHSPRRLVTSTRVGRRAECVACAESKGVRLPSAPENTRYKGYVKKNEGAVEDRV
ncbi:hypothetical protein DBV15_04116, partial [Temnothorax longispinosus]